MLKTIYSLGLLLACFALKAQTDSSKANPNRFKIVALPLAFFTPDTKFGGGVGGLTTFNFPKDSLGARRSSVTVGLVYTQMKQTLIYFPFQLFPQNQRYWINGELGFYNYVFNYFGIGNDVPDDYIEKYTARFPRIRLFASKKIRPHLYLGFRYIFDNYRITQYDSSKLLIRKDVVGATGGRVAGLGIQANYDSRDVFFYPRQGWVGETYFYTEGRATGSQFKYQRFSLDVSRYFPIGKRSVLAFNMATALSFGDVPFHQMPNLGGGKRLRGYFEGKYRDENMALLQAEYRFPLFWRFGAVVFAGLGEVNDKPFSGWFSDTRYHYGTGLRFMLDKAQRINIRADFGIGKNSTGFYLIIGEAF